MNENKLTIENDGRVRWLDIARGISIFLIACGHYVPKELMGFTLLKLFVYLCMSFHVPVFFILSGYIMQPKGSFWSFVQKRIKELLLPWLVFIIIGAIVKLANGTVTFSGLLSTFLYGNLATPAAWFIPILFIVQIIWYPLMKAVAAFKIKRQCLILGSLTLVAYIFGYFVFQSGVRLLFGAQRAVYGFFFIGVGIIASRLIPLKETKELIDKNSKGKLLAFGSILLAIVFAVASRYDFHFDLANMIFPNYWLFALTGIFGVLGVAFISMAIASNRLLECYGRNSLFICLTHEYLIGVFNNSGPMFRPFFASNTVYMVFMTLVGGLWFVAFMLFYYPLCAWKNKLLRRIGYRK